LGLWLALLLAYAGGMVLNLMPCVLPVLSLKVLSFVRHAGAEGGGAWRQGLAFSAGVLGCFWLLAGVLLALRAAGNQVGWGFQLQSPAFVAFLAVLFLVLGLNLLGVFEIGESLTRAGNLAPAGTGLWSSFFGGALATIVATPCTAPFMGSALGWGLSQPVLVSLLVFTALALGMASPYLVLAANPRWLRFVPRPGRWMEGFKQIMGFFLLSTVVFLLWLFGQHTGVTGESRLLWGLLVLAVAAWCYGRGTAPETTSRVRVVALSAALALGVGGGLLAWTASQVVVSDRGGPQATKLGDLTWEEWSPERLAKLRAEERPVFVDFTAAWCLSCQVNERVALADRAVITRLRDAGVALLRADWTKRDGRIAQALAEHGREGVPLYVIYGKGQTEPLVLPELITSAIVLRALDQALGPPASSAHP
jgi:thiol:disulfide interchange protein